MDDRSCDGPCQTALLPQPSQAALKMIRVLLISPVAEHAFQTMQVRSSSHAVNPCLFQEASNDIRNLVVSQPAENLTTPDAKVAPGSEAKSSAPADEKLAKKKRKAAEAAEPLSSVKPRRLGFGSVQKERHDALMDDGLGDSSSENPGEEDEEEEEPACAANPAKALEDVGDEDADLFKDKYALAIPQASACKKTESMPAIMDAPAAASCGGSWDKLPLGIRSKLEKVHSDLIDFLPTALSQCLAGSDEHVMAFVLEFPVMSSAGVAAFLMLRSDFPHFLDILVSEDILNLSDALELVSELGGFCVARECLVN